ncbi:hypothetical protein [Streptomyces sp. NPDC101776]|uniref:hypothetical protein n=1 Tax=Streptomyces sp. NPDC101776 TaxID=3366146 RepID=UPI0037F7F79F
MGDAFLAKPGDSVGPRAGQSRPGRPTTEPDSLLGPELIAWIRWLSGIVDQTWPTRREAARALKIREDELSRMLTGQRMPPREWLDGILVEAVRRATGHTAQFQEREQARLRYMDALRHFEEQEKQRPGKRQARRPTWYEYTLHDQAEEAARREETILGQLERAHTQQRTLRAELHNLRERWKTAVAELEQARRQAGENTEQATRLVRDLEEQIEARELQRTTMLARIRSQQTELGMLRRNGDQMHHELRDLKQRHEWRTDLGHQLKEWISVREHAQNITTASIGVGTATWLVNGFTLQGGTGQKATAVLVCTAGLWIIFGMFSVIVVFPTRWAMTAVSLASYFNWRRVDRHLMTIVPLLSILAMAAGCVLFPYSLWLSSNSLCHEWLGLPITLEAGLPTVMATLVMVVAAILSHAVINLLAAPARILRAIMLVRQIKQENDPADASLPR